MTARAQERRASSDQELRYAIEISGSGKAYAASFPHAKAEGTELPPGIVPSLSQLKFCWRLRPYQRYPHRLAAVSRASEIKLHVTVLISRVPIGEIVVPKAAQVNPGLLEVAKARNSLSPALRSTNGRSFHNRIKGYPYSSLRS